MIISLLLFYAIQHKKKKIIHEWLRKVSRKVILDPSLNSKAPTLKKKAFGMVFVTKSRTKPPTIVLNSPQVTVMPPNIVSALPCITVHMELYFGCC